MMIKINVFYSPYLWRIKKHVGALGNRYLQDMDAKLLWIFEKLKLDSRFQMIKAKPSSKEDICSTHNVNYFNKILINDPVELKKCTWVTWSKSFIRSIYFASGIIYDAAVNALNSKTIVGALVVDGHHAKKGDGSGFCTFNHLAIAVKKILGNKQSERILIIDLDCHFGDGTMSLLGGIKSVYFFDIYGKLHKDGAYKLDEIPESRAWIFKVEKVDDYFEKLGLLSEVIAHIKPDLVFYVAGADIYDNDRYGGIGGMGSEQVLLRDSTVFKILRKQEIPTVFTLGGGYVKYPDIDGKNIEELTTLHVNTFKEASDALTL